MKKLLNRGLMLLASTLMLVSCTDKAEELVPQGTRALDVQVKVQPTSRAMVKGTALAEGAGLGVNVTATDGGLYDGKDAGYLNILYTASGTGANQEWNSTTPVMLSGTEGKMYAYYPHTPGVDFKAITVDIIAQHDWMYGAEAYTVSDKAATAAVVLKHAQTAVNVNVVRDATYTGVGAVSALTVTSEGLASGGTLDTRDGSWSALSGANTAISIISEYFTLDGSTKSSQENPYMFIPASAETKGFVVTATVDGKTYNSSVTMKEAFTKGKVYSVSLKMTNVGLTVSEVTLVDWDEVLLDEGTFQPEVAPIEPTIKIYAMSANNEIIDYNTADETAKGVVLHAIGKNFDKKFMIAKNYAEDVTSSPYIYFPEGPYDMTLLSAYKNIDGTNEEGKLGETFSTDFTTWTVGALSDFNGKANTQAIITTNIGSGYNSLFKVLESFNAGTNSQSNEGFTDWYVPALGQLALIYLAKDEIKTAFEKMSADFNRQEPLWATTFYDENNSWTVHFYNGNIFTLPLEHSEQVEGNSVARFIRDLE